MLTSLEKELVGGLKSEFYALSSCSPESSGKGILAFLVHALILRIIPTQKYISSFDSPFEIMRFIYLPVFMERSLLLLTV